MPPQQPTTSTSAGHSSGGGGGGGGDQRGELHDELRERVEQKKREAEVRRQQQQVSSARKQDVASAREGAAAEAARIARERMEAREQAGASWDGGGSMSPDSRQKLSKKERKQAAKAQKAIINMGMAEWLAEPTPIPGPSVRFREKAIQRVNSQVQRI